MSLRARLEERAFRAGAQALFAWERLTTGVAFDPLSDAHREDPHASYRRLREVDPIHFSRAADGWILARHEDVNAVLADPGFSADERNQRRWPRIRRRRLRMGEPDPYEEGTVSMLRHDPPVHTRLRRLVSRAFTPRAVDRLRPRIEGLVKERLAEAGRDGRLELVEDLAGPLPAIVIAELLGVPAEEHERFRQLSDEAVRVLGESDTDDVRRSTAAREALREIFAEVLEARRREPRDDLISAMAAAGDADDRLTAQELLATCGLLLVAGHETTTKLIANGMIALLRHPGQLALLREDPSRIPAAVEELLRYDGPVQLTSRMVLRDGSFRGRPLRRGQQLVLLLASANRDETVFRDAERLDVTRFERAERADRSDRSDLRHLAFGHGIHFCLGARLARLETACALEGLLERFPRLALEDEPVAWGDNTILRGPTRLRLRVA